MKNTRILFLRVFLLMLISLAPCPLGAADFSLITNQHAEAYNQADEDNAYKYQADILPGFSFLLGGSGEFFISAGFTLGVDGDFYHVPELLRTELSWRFGSSGIRAGRILYSDPLGFIASGLFDGAQFSYNSQIGVFSLGVWYTGFLYKTNAGITMTKADMALYNAPFEYSDFANTYFAPRRMLSSLDWEHPSIAELMRLKIAITSQTDLSDEEDKYHSQYLILKASIPVNKFTFEIGGSVETSRSEAAADNGFDIAFAWDLGVFWMLPTNFNSRLSFTGYSAGGKTEKTGVFIPVTGKLHGNVLQVRLPGISILSLDYTARLNNSFGMSVSASHFVRNDIGTYTAYPVNTEDNNGYFLGTEFFARLVWSPVSDLHFTFGGGAFVPLLGNVNQDEKSMWRAELSAILALY